MIWGVFVTVFLVAAIAVISFLLSEGSGSQ